MARHAKSGVVTLEEVWDDDAFEDFIDAVTSAFALRLDGTTVVETYGDIFAHVRSHYAPGIGSAGACHTSMAFWRIRRAIGRETLAEDIRPTTPLRRLSGVDPRRFLGQLAKQSGLRMPDASGGFAGCALFIGLIIGLTLALTAAFAWSFSVVAASVLISIIANRFDRGKMPSELVTVGDLARRVAALNYDRLVRLGAGVRESTHWDAFAELALFAMNDGEISREKIIFKRAA